MKLASTKILALLAPLCLVTASFAPVPAPGQTGAELAGMKALSNKPIDRPSRSPLFVPVAPSEQGDLDLVAVMRALTGLPEWKPQPLLPDANNMAGGNQ